jgi:hypothetical protein
MQDHLRAMTLRSAFCALILPAAVCLSIASTPAIADRTVFYRGASSCGNQYFKWTARKGHWMGFAVNERIGKRQSCGWSLRAATRKAAIAKAMARCRAMSHKHPRYGRADTCFLYDIK